MSDRQLINATKEYEPMRKNFYYLKSNDMEFAVALESFAEYEVRNERNSKAVRYDGSFDSLLETLYTIRGNIIHGADFSGMNNECHKLAYQILYVVLRKQVFPTSTFDFP